MAHFIFTHDFQTIFQRINWSDLIEDFLSKNLQLLSFVVKAYWCAI
jgi:hypothetical protein